MNKTENKSLWKGEISYSTDTWYMGRIVVKGGSLWTLTQESTFSNEFGGKIRVTDKVIQKNQNTATKKIENWIYNYKMVVKKPITISRHNISNQKWENTFPKEFFL